MERTMTNQMDAFCFLGLVIEEPTKHLEQDSGVPSGK